jgi:PEP-CTERM motif-containing protein
MLRLLVLAIGGLILAPTTHADPILFSTGLPNTLIGMASRPPSPGGIEIEAADDFVLNAASTITGGSFWGVATIPGAPASITDVVVSFYNIFPADSTNPPNGLVPTRTNSPADSEFASSESAAATLTFGVGAVTAGFAANSVLNGIFPIPNQTTGGEGPISGAEVLINFTLVTPLDLPAGHYFFVPQVEFNNGAQFYWLSAPKPIIGGTGPFAGDLQTWMRNSDLDPNWLRVGTDIVGSGAFNGAFSLNGTSVPEPATLVLAALGLVGLYAGRRRFH